jgi:anti-anti-sigma factor
VAANPPALRLDLDLSRPDVATLTVSGECDLAEAPRLLEVIRGAARAAAEVRVVIDGLEFIDSAGLHALHRAKRELGEAKRRLVLVGPTPGVRRVLEISKLDTYFDVRDHSDFDGGDHADALSRSPERA